MRFLTYNIQYGLGRDGRFDLARIADEVRHADVVALQEVERFWRRSGEVDQPAELARHLGGWFWVYGANLDGSLNSNAIQTDGSGNIFATVTLPTDQNDAAWTPYADFKDDAKP